MAGNEVAASDRARLRPDKRPAPGHVMQALATATSTGGRPPPIRASPPARAGPARRSIDPGDRSEGRAITVNSQGRAQAGRPGVAIAAGLSPALTPVRVPAGVSAAGRNRTRGTMAQAKKAGFSGASHGGFSFPVERPRPRPRFRPLRAPRPRMPVADPPAGPAPRNRLIRLRHDSRTARRRRRRLSPPLLQIGAHRPRRPPASPGRPVPGRTPAASQNLPHTASSAMSPGSSSQTARRKPRTSRARSPAPRRLRPRSRHRTHGRGCRKNAGFRFIGAARLRAPRASSCQAVGCRFGCRSAGVVPPRARDSGRDVQRPVGEWSPRALRDPLPKPSRRDR